MGELNVCFPGRAGSGAAPPAWEVRSPVRAMRDAGHLFRLLAIFAVGALTFLVVRSFIVPRSFGEYGHYRGNAIAEIAARPLRFAGHQTCETCHVDILAIKKNGKHAGVNCEACHGPLAKHAGDPSFDPGKPATATLCVRCHSASAARPKGFPQVQAAEHSGGMACETCHNPHSPAISAGAKK